MTSEEFDRFRAHTIVEYAAAHTSVGNWSKEEAIEKSTQSMSCFPMVPRPKGHWCSLRLLAKEFRSGTYGLDFSARGVCQVKRGYMTLSYTSSSAERVTDGLY